MGPRRMPVRRTVQHPRLVELRFEGSRVLPDGPVTGDWVVTTPGFARHVSVDLVTGSDGAPMPEELAWLEAFFADLDGFYAHIRPALTAEYEHWVGGAPPADWRTAFRLDWVRLPGDDVDDPAAWKVHYWCEGAAHWFVIWLSDREVTDVIVEG